LAGEVERVFATRVETPPDGVNLFSGRDRVVCNAELAGVYARGMVWLWRLIGLRRILALFALRKAWGMYQSRKSRSSASGE